MKKERKRITPFSLIMALLSLGASVYFYLTVKKLNIVPQNYMTYGLIALGVLNLIILAMALTKCRKWFQIILSLLLCAVLAAGIYVVNIGSDLVFNKLPGIFTTVPDKLERNVDLFAKIIYYNGETQEFDSNASYEPRTLSSFTVGDIKSAVADLSSKVKSVKPYYTQDIHSLRVNWDQSLRDTLLLPEMMQQILNEVFYADNFLTFSHHIYRYTETISSDLKDDVKPDMLKDSFTILVGGNTSLGTKDDSDFMELSDFNLLVAVNPKTKNILLFTLPKDTYLTLNGDAKKPDRISTASFYGMATWEDSVGNLLSCDINYYLRFNYSDIGRLVDALGYLTIDNPYGFQSTTRSVKDGDKYKDDTFYFDAGNITLNGDQVVEYLREQKHLTTPAVDRQRNFLIVANALVNKIKSYLSIINDFKDIKQIPEVYNRVLNLANALQGTIATDIPVTRETGEMLAGIVKDFSSWTITNYTVLADYRYMNSYTANKYPLLAGVISDAKLKEIREIIKNILDK